MMYFWKKRILRSTWKRCWIFQIFVLSSLWRHGASCFFANFAKMWSFWQW